MRTAPLLLISIALAGCLAGDEALSIDVGDDPLDDPRFAELRARLAVTVRPGEGGFEGDETCSETSSSPCCNTTYCSPTGLVVLLSAACRAEAVESGRSSTGCGIQLRDVDSDICVAQRLLEIVEHPAERGMPVTGQRLPLTIGPQDEETNSALALAAIDQASRALRRSRDRLLLASEPGGGGTTPAVPCERDHLALSAFPGGTPVPMTRVPTLGEELASFYVEALEITRVASEHLSRSSRAVSDAYLSRGLDRGRSAELRIAPFASRIAAAHALVGGDHLMPAFGTGANDIGRIGLFSQPPLSARATRALAILREAAMDPVLVVAEESAIPLDQLIAGGASVPEHSSDEPTYATMRARLARIHGEPGVAEMSPGQLYSRLGLDATAFGEARAWLAAEIRAYDRPIAQSGPRRARILDPERLADGTVSDFPLYAATRLPPRSPLPVYWSTVLRYDPTPVSTSSNVWEILAQADGAVPAGHTWGTETTRDGRAVVRAPASGRTVASVYLDAAYSAQAIMGQLAPGVTDTPEVQDALRRTREILARGIPEGYGVSIRSAGGGDSTARDGATVLGAARICGASPSGETTYILQVALSLSGEVTGYVLRVVLGREGLDCAVRGEVDGVPCTPSDLADSLAPVSSGSPGVLTPVSGSPGAFQRAFLPAPGTGPSPDLTAYYVVRAPAADAGPGGWEPVTGFVVGPVERDDFWCMGTAISPELDRDVDALVGMAEDDHARSRTDCAGLPWDQQIPLENELTDDRDDVESSWRHYLQGARAAALEADALGEDLVRLGIEMDARAEQQVDELQQLCGVRINVSAISREAPAMVRPLTGTECPAGYALGLDRASCVLDLVAWASTVGALRVEDERALQACIGSDSKIDWVALGDQSVCLWQYGPDPTTVCANTDPDHPCPRVVFGASGDAATACGAFLPGEWAPPGTTSPIEPTPLLASEKLGLFEIPAPPLNTGQSTGDSARALPCEAIARLRALAVRDDAYDGTPHTALEDLGRFAESALLEQRSYIRYASQLGWEPSAGAFSRVTYAGSTIAMTGWYGADPAELQMWPAGRNVGGVDVFEGLCPRESGFSDPVDDDESIFCLTDVSQARTGEAGSFARARANDMLLRAVIAARVIGGVSLADNDRILLPYYPYNVRGARMRSAEGSDYSEEPRATDFWVGREGRIEIDDTIGDDTGYRDTDLAALRGYTERITEDGWDEWIRCPYERDDAECLRFDWSTSEEQGAASSYAPRWRDVEEYQLPLVVRRVAPEVRVDGSAARVRSFFRSSSSYGWLFETVTAHVNGDYSAGVDRQAHTSLGGVELQTVSDYFKQGLEWRNGDFGHACSDHHLGCVEQNASVDVRATAQGDAAHAEHPDRGLSIADVLNGLELTCMAARIDGENPGLTSCGSAPEVRSLRDLLQAQAFLQCQSDEIDAAAGATVVPNLPRRLVEAIRQRGSSARSADEGDIATQVSTLASSYERLRVYRGQMAGELRGIAGDIRELRSTVRESEIAREVEELRLGSAVSARIAACAVAAGNAKWDQPQSYAGALSACADSVVQIGIAVRLRDLGLEGTSLALESAFAGFDQRVNAHITRMGEIAIGIRTDLAQIDGALAQLASARSRARRALARALYLEHDDTGAHFALSSAYRARYNTALTRYLAARDRALRSAFIARRAVEQRLAMPLDTMVTPLRTVAAPATWADELCTMPAIDYEQIRLPQIGPDGTVSENPVNGPDGYAGAFIGDYVQRLEQVVESYSFGFPFRDGTDTVVVSLRDDVFRTLADCDVPSPNLLYQSNYLDIQPESGTPGWAVEGCDDTRVPAAPEGETRNAHCVSVLPPRPDERSVDAIVEGAVFPSGGTDLGRPTPFRFRFGGSAATLPEAAVTQTVRLRGGRYRLSWYGRRVGSVGGLEPSDAVIATDASGNLLTPRTTDPVAVETAEGWARFHTFFDVASEGDVRIVITPDFPEGDLSLREVELAGLMLEDVSGRVVGDVWQRQVADPRSSDPGMPELRPLAEIARPEPFVETGPTRTRVLRECRDTTGETFRREAWSYGCTTVCPDGYDRTCDPLVATSRCYWEISVPLGVSRLERLLTGTPAGFAAGNYNYRIESVGVNVVGTGIRDCSASSAGCYGSANVAYSLLHEPPYLVTNARGEVYPARIFPGRIESARALAAERYLSNPISSADQALIQPSARVDFRGRPLAGGLVLRIWDEPTLDFDRIEDVQLVLQYRYWQHQR